MDRSFRSVVVVVANYVLVDVPNILAPNGSASDRSVLLCGMVNVSVNLGNVLDSLPIRSTAVSPVRVLPRSRNHVSAVLSADSLEVLISIWAIGGISNS